MEDVQDCLKQNYQRIAQHTLDHQLPITIHGFIIQLSQPWIISMFGKGGQKNLISSPTKLAYLVLSSNDF